MGQTGGSALACAVLAEAPAGLPAAAETDLWVVCACSGGLRGEMSLRLPAPTAMRLAQILMGDAPSAEAASASPNEGSSEQQTAAVPPVPAEQSEAAMELLRQVAGLVASALKPQWGEVQLRLEPAAGAPSWPSSLTGWVRAGENPGLPLEVQLSAALVAAWRAEGTRADKGAAAQPVAAEGAALPPSPAQAGGKGSSVSLDLLMDVELALTLRFGTRSVPLSEILDFNPGSVIELDRQVEDPVDVLLDGRVVARGEVVVMDGNYGLRITEIAPPAGT
jgi:flagellar motor switch protein FliN